MAQHGAYQFMAAAMRGEAVPEQFRSDDVYSLENIQGGHGSANIPVMHALNDLWWNFHQRDFSKVRLILQACEKYFAMNRFQTKEPYGCHVYQGWIMSFYYGLHVFLKTTSIGSEYPNLRKSVERFLWFHFAIYTLAATQDGFARVSLPGSRSWVGPSSAPYRHITGGNEEPATLDAILTNNINQMNSWEGSLIKVGVRKRNYDPFTYISPEMVGIARNIIRNTETESQLRNFLKVMEQTGVKAYIPIVFVRTDRCSGAFCPQSRSSGSTSFMYAKFYYKNGRPVGPWYETWADDTDRHWGWLAAAGYHRIADSGGVADMDITNGDVEIRCQTRNDGPNPKRIGPDNDGDGHKDFIVPHEAYWHQPSGNTTNPDAWKKGWRSIPVPGRIRSIVKFGGMTGSVKLIQYGDQTNDDNEEPEVPTTTLTPPGIKLFYRTVRLVMKLANEGLTASQAADNPDFRQTYQRLINNWKRNL